jgi:hypothetical protein
MRFAGQLPILIAGAVILMVGTVALSLLAYRLARRR